MNKIKYLYALVFTVVTLVNCGQSGSERTQPQPGASDPKVLRARQPMGRIRIPFFDKKNDTGQTALVFSTAVTSDPSLKDSRNRYRCFYSLKGSYVDLFENPDNAIEMLRNKNTRLKRARPIALAGVINKLEYGLGYVGDRSLYPYEGNPNKSLDYITSMSIAVDYPIMFGFMIYSNRILNAAPKGPISVAYWKEFFNKTNRGFWLFVALRMLNGGIEYMLPARPRDVGPRASQEIGEDKHGAIASEEVLDLEMSPDASMKALLGIDSAIAKVGNSYELPNKAVHCLPPNELADYLEANKK